MIVGYVFVALVVLCLTGLYDGKDDINALDAFPRALVSAAAWPAFVFYLVALHFGAWATWKTDQIKKQNGGKP